MTVLDGQAMRDDIVSRLLGGEPDLATSKYLDRISELAGLEEAEKTLGGIGKQDAECEDVIELGGAKKDN